VHNSFTILGLLAASVMGLLGAYVYARFVRRKASANQDLWPSDQSESQASETSSPTVPEQTPSEPTKPHAKPKILLVDLDKEAHSALTGAGYKAVEGSFGRPYSVTAGDGFCQVVEDAKLPGLMEQEIVVADLDVPEPLSELSAQPGPQSAPGWWAKQTHGVVDPRPTAMSFSRPYTDRILSHGGLIIVFAAPREPHEYVWAHKERGGLVSDSGSQGGAILSNWSLVQILDQRLDFGLDFGEEVSVADGRAPILDILRKFRAQLRFRCTMVPKYGKEPWWKPLASNKYGSVVAASIAMGEGEILILPRVLDQASFLCELFQNVLPEMFPHLFPYHAGAGWVRDTMYELPTVVDLQRQIADVETAAREKTEALNEAIAVERASMGFQHELLRQTGDHLVSAVKRALAVIGFTSVLDSDELVSTGRRREDLQIHDRSPVLLVEVKGIAGMPTEHDAIQVGKYLAPRMKEWGRTDVGGVSIINHQRNVPGLDRSPSPFTDVLLTNAVDQQFGLMTSWDLFRLVRNFLQLGWRPDDVRPLLYRHGRIEAVPAHYEYVGVIERYWEKVGVVGIRVVEAAVQQGDRIAYELPIDYVEQEVQSLQAERLAVASAAAGVLAGVKTNLTKKQARTGVRVFRVKAR